MRRTTPFVTAACAAVFFASTGTTQVRILSARDSVELVARVATLRAGDRLQLADREYRVPGLTLANLRGNADGWIVIQGATVGRTRIVGTSTRSNVIDIADCSHLRLEDLDITSEGRAVDGIKFRYGTSSDQVVVEGCTIHDVGQGVTSQATLLSDLELNRCEITRTTGSGVYLGYDDPPRIAARTLIRNCWLHDCAQGGATGYGIQIKGNSYGARIENNVLHDVAGSSRAAIATYFANLAGDAPRERWNEIRNNVIWSTPNTGIYATNCAVIECNTVIDAERGIATTAYGSATVANLRIRNNTVFRCRNAGLDLGGFGRARTETIVVANNASLMTDLNLVALRNQSGPGQATFVGNAVHGGVQGQLSTGFVRVGAPTAEFVAAAAGATPPHLDLRPAETSGLRDAGRRDLSPDTDTLGRPRPGGPTTDAGAWLHGSGASPWTIRTGFKLPLDQLRPLRQSAVVPGSATLRLDARLPGLAGAPFVVLASQTAPSISRDSVIRVEPLTHAILETPAHFVGYMGAVPPSTDVACSIRIAGLPPVPHDTTLYHAVVALRRDGSLHATNPVRVVLVPGSAGGGG